MRRCGLSASLALFLLAACADLGPAAAHITSIQAWSCVGDTLPCHRNVRIERPEVGKYFGVKASAPGAVVMRYRLVFPNDWGNPATYESVPIVADTVSDAYKLRFQLPWLTWVVEVLWYEGRIVDADSLHWTWP